MSDVFSSVVPVVDPTSNLVVVYWDLYPGAIARDADPDFYVEVARSVDATWTRLNPTNPVNGVCQYVDDDEELKGCKWQVLFRIVMDLNSVETASDPVGMYEAGLRQERLLLAELERRAYVGLNSSGVHGYFLHKKDFGTACSCVDPDLDTPGIPNCPDCFGTGLEGGYYLKVESAARLLEPGTFSRKETGMLGVEASDDIALEALCHPRVFPDDVWVSRDSGKMYRIGNQTQISAAFRDMPILLQMKATLLDPSDIMYTFDLSDYGIPLADNDQILLTEDDEEIT